MVQIIVSIIATTIIGLAIGFFHKDIQRVRDIFDKRRNERRQIRKDVRNSIIKKAVQEDVYYLSLQIDMSDDLKSVTIGFLGIILMMTLYMLLTFNFVFPMKPIENPETYKLISKIFFLVGYTFFWGMAGSALRDYHNDIKLFRDIDREKFKFEPDEHPSKV